MIVLALLIVGAPVPFNLLQNWRGPVAVADGGGPPADPYSPAHVFDLDGGGPPADPYAPTHIPVLS